MDANPTAEAYYETFIEQVRATGQVWGLCRDGEEWAYSESDEFEETEVLLFWSDRAKALIHQQDEWESHEATSIPLEEFMDKWLSGMDQDGLLVGPNWDAAFVGQEVSPDELAERLLDDAEEADEESED